MSVVDEHRRKVITLKATAILAKQLGILLDKIEPDASVRALDVDSLDAVEMVIALEDEFDIEITDEQAEKIVTVGNAIDFMKSL